MREVKLELLRQGPAHNQLLSPLTEYLVLCGNSPADSLRIGFEHQEFLAHLSALRYDLESDPEGQRFHLDRLRTLISKIITELGDLESEVSAAGGDWLNLRMVISPAELSILPFEIAKSPDCFPAAELPLLLNPHRPVVLTREIRQNGSRAYAWPTEPRILVAATDIPGASVPIKAHLLALRRALDPWMGPDARLEDFIRVLERASVQDIIAACDEESFTHVHILAHGGKLKNGGHGYGLVLHDPEGDGTDVVDGRRLAEALCRPTTHGFSHHRPADQRQPEDLCRPTRGLSHHRPAVVVLASCDSGARSELWYTGASMAQVLHGAGIPLVVASQFPLSKPGSVILTEELYRRLFAGEDPRQALYFARRELKVRVPQAHDYVSLVAYTGLPEDLESQLVGVRLRRALGLLKASRKWALDKSKDEATFEQRRKAYESRLAMAEAILCSEQEEQASAHGTAHRGEAAYIAEACGLLGSLYKRRADLEFMEDRSQARCQATLRKARDWYERGSIVHVGVGADFVSHWNAVQSLALSAVIEAALLDRDQFWQRARASAEQVAYDPTVVEDRIWACGSLAELWMLQPLTIPTMKKLLGEQLWDGSEKKLWEDSRRAAVEHIEELKRRAPGGPDSDYITSTRAQLERYTTCWAQCSVNEDFGRVVETARDLLSRLSQPVQTRTR